ncbi:hypothetical protein [Streptomyces mirabilis]|uniref:hypothetical protein n=1 Tax=Streptomyces mirabilis TaxID=68239 RepID=UPI0009449AF4|nr:hypothetical protein [Streptomyces mirabilis]
MKIAKVRARVSRHATRFRPCHLPARLPGHARRRFLRIGTTWPWAKTFTTCWHRLTALPAVT